MSANTAKREERAEARLRREREERAQRAPQSRANAGAVASQANAAAREVAFDNSVDVIIDQSRGWRFGLPDGRARRHRSRVRAADDRTVAVQRLLDELCVELGFCLPSREQARLLQSPPTDPDEFTNAVFAAEGMDPHLFPDLRSEVSIRVQSGLSQRAR
jgi:hypothetical protein